MEYTADSIRILDHSEAAHRFAWLDAETLASRYRRPVHQPILIDRFIPVGKNICLRIFLQLENQPPHFA